MCRVCGKALCKDCVMPSSFGITCKGECAKSAIQMSEQMAGLKRRQGLMKKFSGYYVLVMGLIFGILSFFLGNIGLMRYLILIIAVGLIVFGVFLMRKNK